MRSSPLVTHLLLGTALIALAPAIACAQSAKPIAEVLAAADEAWSARKFDVAFVQYQAVLRQDSTSLPALFRIATMLGWQHDFERSAKLFRAYLRLAPNDDDARIGLARTLAWAGDYDQAIAICDSVVARDPQRDDAVQLGAQVRAWSVALAPSFEPSVFTMDDSDDNRTTTYLVRGALASLWTAHFIGDASYRVADFGGEHGTSIAFRMASSWAPNNGQWTLHAEAGAARVGVADASGSVVPTRVLPLLGVRLTERPARAITIGTSVTRAPFDETAPLMLAGIATTSLAADADVTLGSRFDLSADGSWTRLSGGSGPNSRVSASGALRWFTTSFASIAASVRGFTYDHAAFDGYFAPEGYVLAEVSGRLHLGGELGWGLDSELGLGNQTIALFDDSRAGRFAQRASVTIAYRPLPGFEWALSGGFANIASPTTISSADYRAFTAAIRARFRL